MFYAFIIVLLIGILFLVYYNILFKAYNNMNKAFSDMDVYLKKRYDMIPKLIDVAKGYAKSEKDILSEISGVVSKKYDTLNDVSKIKLNEFVGQSLVHIIILAEKYPKLNSDKLFKELQVGIEKLESNIAKSRIDYNDAVKVYNEKISIFPNKIFAKLLGYRERSYFEISKREEQNINIEI